MAKSSYKEAGDYIQPGDYNQLREDAAGVILTSHGDIIFRNASELKRLAPGTSGQLLKTQGPDADPVWGWPDLVEDIVGSALTTITLDTSTGAWTKTTSLNSGADLTIATKTQSYASQSRAVSVGVFCMSASADSIKVRHFMGGVQVAETDYIGNGDLYIMLYTKSLSGSQECKLVAHNYYGTSRVFTICGFQSGYEGSIAIAIGSLKAG